MPLGSSAIAEEEATYLMADARAGNMSEGPHRPKPQKEPLSGKREARAKRNPESTARCCNGLRMSTRSDNHATAALIVLSP